MATAKLPDMIIEVPEGGADIDISLWCADMKRAYGKTHNVIFRFKNENNENTIKEGE